MKWTRPIYKHSIYDWIVQLNDDIKIGMQLIDKYMYLDIIVIDTVYQDVVKAVEFNNTAEEIFKQAEEELEFVMYDFQRIADCLKGFNKACTPNEK